MAIIAKTGPSSTFDGSSALERREAVRSDRVARYERMVEIRLVEQRIRDLLTEGHAWGTTHSCDGQEAVAVGIAAAARPTDLVVGSHRAHGLGMALGMSPEAIIAEIMGKSDGAVGGTGGSAHLTDTTIGLLYTVTLMGAGIPVTVGNAMAIQVTGSDAVAISVFGDGAANIGAFHEGLNLASVWKVPAVFVCENNHYGEYSRYDKTTPITIIAKRAESYAMPWLHVDGQDVDAVAAAIEEAIDRARRGGGPTLVEAKTYRYQGHNRTDRAVYRPEGELEEWLARDPITILGERLVTEGLLDAAGIDEIRARGEQRVEAAVEFAFASPEPDTAAMFRYVYPKEVDA
ncbi:MAG: thiamine pyrophosphate-dependent dehydrogenase E1 component subunit alpha [Actinobacteria bacterium]|nr:thiamine pyrophosphate-dependent dehydrogenase E1 component subunit alpha [Actinomycetota bacterium]